MLTKLKRTLSSFSIKLFLWFWLIAMISIVSTRIITTQLLTDNSNKIITKPLFHKDFRQLKRITKKIAHLNNNNITQISQLKNMVHPNANLWFKIQNESDTKDSKIQNLFSLKPEHQKSIEEYISDNKFTQATTTLFRHTRLTGPLLITLNKQSYQIFISHKLHRSELREFVQRIPSWVRITIITIISFILCWLLARSLSKPLLIIKKAAIDLGGGNLSSRVQGVIQRSDELGELAVSFNQMASKLEQNLSAHQRLLGDVSHELRSPMTRLQMALALAQQENATEQVRNQYLQRCELEVQRLDHMITDVLALSRLENTIQNLQLESFNFTQLIHNIIDDEQFFADEKSIIITKPTSSPIILLADSNMLASAVSNILNNAIKYSPTQSTISISLSVNKQQLTLAISDAGNGVPPQSLQQLFEPFYRVNDARDRKTGGTGLGLAIAKQAIITHKGQIFAINNSVQNGKGLTVTIILPLCSNTNKSK